MADCDEQQWREMGCPTMGTALSLVVSLEEKNAALEVRLFEALARLGRGSHGAR